MNTSRLSKSLLIASVIFVMVGLGLLFWPTASTPNTPNTNVNQSNAPQASRNSAGPIPEPQTVASPKHLQSTEPDLVTTTVILQSGDSLSRILSRLGVNERQISQLIRADQDRLFDTLQPNQKLTVTVDQSSSELSKITLKPNVRESHTFTYKLGTFDYNKQLTDIEIVTVYREVVVANSLFVSGANAGISDKLLFQLTDIFRWDIDFALDIRKGDRFAILFEEQRIDGETVGFGNIIAAQFINNGRIFEAIRYQTQARTDYFTPDGLSLRKAFIRTPVDFTRISSPFNPNRLHPIFKTTRPHQGVDYAAPKGTPVQSAGDGSISFVGHMKGYGYSIIVDHGYGYTTLYAHLNDFAEQMIAGRDVEQGQTIAYVGETGWATGPHLHYEFRVNGQHQNPETVTIPNASPMTKNELRTFLPYANRLMTNLRRRHSPNFEQALASLRR